jgi:outer membrane protein assembly factor BamB
MGIFKMRRLAVILASCGFLAACSGDSWLGDTPPPPLPGKRISILSQSKALQADSGNKAPISLPPPEIVADWPQAGGYPPHAMHHLAVSANLHLIWQVSVGTGGDSRRAFLTQPIVAGGKVFAMDAESTVSAFDLKTGKRYWQADLAPEDSGAGSYGGGLAFEDGKLFITSQYAELLSVNAADGKILWRRNLPSPVRGAPTVRAGRVLLVTVDNETLALSAEDGPELWHHIGISELA